MPFRPRVINTGHKGQRYEVRALRPREGGGTWEPFVVGWTEQPDGGSLVTMVAKHPSWTSARVIDLGEDEILREPSKNLAGWRP